MIHDDPNPASRKRDDEPESLASRFQVAWTAWFNLTEQDASRPDIRHYMGTLQGDSRRRLLIDLVRIDAASRRQLGEVPGVRDYLSVAENNLSAIEDALLLSEAPARARAFQTGASGTEETTDQYDLSTRRERTFIGPYKILQKIGEGGMGTVWMAEQKLPVRRQVALKLIKTGIDSKDVIARFEAERQALAMMDHQHIAKVFDAGTTDDGQPYFVMELVKGIPITEFCDQNRLTPEERLRIFATVCQAIQHSHQKGVMHRDIKPSNVLVSFFDGKPIAKVIDFGLAKAIEPQLRLTDMTLVSEFGKVIGTIQYMSPEQAGTNALDVDTRTDVYSLGILLYELLTGSTPLNQDVIKHKAILEVIRWVHEKDPPKPSKRLSDSGPAVTKITEKRRMGFHHLSKILKGDLDWIVMKAIEKERGRRYASAEALAEDVERFLNKEVVEARPSSMVYRVSKFIRKHRIVVGVTGALLALALLAGLLSIRVAYLELDRATVIKERDLARTMALAVVGTARSDSVLSSIFRLPPGTITVEQIRDYVENTERLSPAAKLNYALAREALRPGETQDFLLQQIPEATELDFKSILSTFKHSNSPGLAPKLDKEITSAMKSSDFAYAARLIVSLIGTTSPPLDSFSGFLDGNRGPEIRCRLIHAIPKSGIPVEHVIKYLEKSLGSEKSVSLSSSLVQTLGTYSTDALSAVQERLMILGETAFQSHHIELHSSGEWLLRQLGIERLPVVNRNEEPSRGHGSWYVTKTHNHEMAILQGSEFVMGTPIALDASGEPRRGPGGEYQLVGDANGNGDEFQVKISIPRKFGIATKEVTVLQIREFGEANGILVSPPHNCIPKSSCPAYCNWISAALYCNWLSEREGIRPEQWCYDSDGSPKTGFLELNGYRLPTEAEWEFACRSDTKTLRYFGDTNSSIVLDEYVWHVGNSNMESHPVGQKKPSGFGLFDIIGNSWEWCNDWYYRNEKIRIASTTPDNGKNSIDMRKGNRLLRGGSFADDIRFARSAIRHSDNPEADNRRIKKNRGFRVARTLSVLTGREQ